MIAERMVELLLLGDIIDTYNCCNSGRVASIEGKDYDSIKVLNRYSILLQEFLSPYVIDKNSKE